MAPNIPTRTLRDYVNSFPRVDDAQLVISPDLTVGSSPISIDGVNAGTAINIDQSNPQRPSVSLDIASQAEAEAGELNDKGMTPLRTWEALGAFTKRYYAEYFGIYVNDPTAAYKLQQVIDEYSETGGIIIVLDRVLDGSGYIWNQTVTLKKGCIITAPDEAQWNLNGDEPYGCVKITMADGANCDAFNFATDAFGAALVGISVSGNRINNTAGAGVRFLGEVVAPGSGTEKRTKAMVRWCEFKEFAEDGVRLGFRPTDGNNIQRIYSVNMEYVSSHHNGGYGFRGITGDLSVTKCFGWHNDEAGWFEEAGSGATRGHFCDFWDNGTYGQILEGQNSEWVHLQTDLNRIGGTRIRKNATGSVPANITFNGGNTNQNAEDGNGGSDFHISDGAFGIVWSDFKFGYIASAEGRPGYAIYDDSASPGANIVQGLWRNDNGQYTIDFCNELVWQNYAVLVSGVGATAFPNPHVTRSTNQIIGGGFRKWGPTLPYGWSLLATPDITNPDMGSGFGKVLKISSVAAATNQGLDQVLDIDGSTQAGERVFLVALARAVGTTTTKSIQIREGSSPTSAVVPNDGFWHAISVRSRLSNPILGALAVRIAVKASTDGVTVAGADTLEVRCIALTFGTNAGAISDHPADAYIGSATLANSATPNVSGYEVFVAADATTVTSLLGPTRENREVSILGNGTKQFNSGGNIRNRGGANVTPANGDLITYRFVNGLWREV